MARQYREEEGKEAPVDEFVELDLDKTLTWTGNSVIVQRGAVFRMPLLVPQPSVLAIQFEIEGGYDIEFSLTFKEDHEEESVVMVHTSARNSLHHIQSLQTHPDAGRGVPVVPLAGLSVAPDRVTDREGQLDIDTTGVCEIIWSNEHSWISSKTLSYQLQLAPKLDVRWRKRLMAVATAATDFRMLAAVEMAEKVDEDLRSLKQRTSSLQQTATSTKERTAAAHAKHERYLSHVQRLEEEVAAAKQHADAAAAELQQAHAEETTANRALASLHQVRHLDDGLTPGVLSIVERCDEALELIFDAYAGSLYAPEESDGSEASQALDRAELLHFLQDVGLLGRSRPPQVLCAVFNGCPQQLTRQLFKRAFSRAALVLAPETTGSQAPGEGGAVAEDEAARPERKMLWFLRALADSARGLKLPVLDIRRRVEALQALDKLSATVRALEEEKEAA